METQAAIRDFINERISGLHCKAEEIPVKLRLLADAARDVDDQEAEMAIDGKTKKFRSILHAAAAIGLHKIIDMQIRTGVDVTGLDDHSWTALMVASAQEPRPRVLHTSLS